MSFLENFKKRRDFLLTPVDHSRKIGIIFFFISLFLHGLFFCSILFFQDFRLPKPMPSVIQIDLVSFSPEPLGVEIKKSEESMDTESVSVKSWAIKKKNRKISTIKADISLKTKPKNLKELMAQQEKKSVEKKTPENQIDSEKVLEEAREKLEKKVMDQNQDQIAQALSRFQKKVKNQGESIESENKGLYAGAGNKKYKPIDLYKMDLGFKIEQNWVFNDTLARMDQNLEVRILIKILKSGEIRDIIYETKSGNRYLDESAKKAIKKANPLSPLPAGMHSYDVGIIFTPKGLK